MKYKFKIIISCVLLITVVACLPICSQWSTMATQFIQIKFPYLSKNIIIPEDLISIQDPNCLSWNFSTYSSAAVTRVSVSHWLRFFALSVCGAALIWSGEESILNNHHSTSSQSPTYNIQPTVIPIPDLKASASPRAFRVPLFLWSPFCYYYSPAVEYIVKQEEEEEARAVCA